MHGLLFKMWYRIAHRIISAVCASLTLKAANEWRKATMFVESITFHYKNHLSSSVASVAKTSPTVSDENISSTKTKQDIHIEVWGRKVIYLLKFLFYGVLWPDLTFQTLHMTSKSFQCKQVRMISVPLRSKGKKLQYYVTVDRSEKVISPGLPLVTLCEQQCSTYSELPQLKERKETKKKCNINNKLPKNQWFQWMIHPGESDFDS